MATITERRGYHILNWSGPDTDPRTGKPRRHRLSLSKVGAIPKRDLDAILATKQYELSTGAKLLNAHRRPAPRFEDFVRREYLPWHRGEYPDSHYRVEQIALDHLIPHFGASALNLITVEQGEAFKTKRRFLVEAGTLVKEIRVLMAIINRAVALKQITDNPIAAVKAPKDLKSSPHLWYSAEELSRLYAASSYGPIWRLYANTGLRRTEGIILRWLWVSDSKVRILSTGEERTKDGEWRDVPKTDGARLALEQLEQKGPYVLPRIRKESLSRAFARDADAAGLDGSLQTLRHTFVCHMLLAGVPTRTVQLYAGHAKISTTENYAYQVLRIDPDAAVRLAI